MFGTEDVAATVASTVRRRAAVFALKVSQLLSVPSATRVCPELRERFIHGTTTYLEDVLDGPLLAVKVLSEQATSQNGQDCESLSSSHFALARIPPYETLYPAVRLWERLARFSAQSP